MTPEEFRISRALDSLWEKFQNSSLIHPQLLQNLSLIYKGGETLWEGSFIEGEIHAVSNVELTDAKNVVYTWQANFIYEREPDQLGEFLHWGMAYSEVGIWLPNGSIESYKIIYNIGGTDLLTNRKKTIQLSDLNTFSRSIMLLAENCLADLAYVCQNNLFSEIASLALRIKEPLASNPFKE